MKVLNKGKFISFLDSLSKNYELFAPVKKGSRVNFERVNNAKDICFDYIVTDNNPSNLVFPKRETLFTIKKGETISIEENKGEIEKSVVFGVRPCDALALTKLDKLFNWDGLKDSHYNNKRDNILVIGMACNKSEGTCFCTSVGSGPHQKDNVDVMVYILDKDFVVDAVTKKGNEILKFIKGKNFSKPDKLKELEKQAISSIKHKFDHKQLENKLDKIFNHVEFWKEQTNKCLRCGACAMSCPACYCFDMADEGAEKCRFWDACTFKVFTKQASGFNPRADKFRGYRQRFYHKFNYFNKRFGEPLCVGCGRCTIHCPSNVDILEIALNVPERIPEKKEQQKTENRTKVC